jgi:hypothetical protein
MALLNEEMTNPLPASRIPVRGDVLIDRIRHINATRNVINGLFTERQKRCRMCGTVYPKTRREVCCGESLD